MWNICINEKKTAAFTKICKSSRHRIDMQQKISSKRQSQNAISFLCKTLSDGEEINICYDMLNVRDIRPRKYHVTLTDEKYNKLMEITSKGMVSA